MSDNGHHCPEHEAYHDTLARVATNTDWIISALKWAATIAGALVTLIIIPTSLWLISLDKRITNLETQIAYHLKK